MLQIGQPRLCTCLKSRRTSVGDHAGNGHLEASIPLPKAADGQSVDRAVR
jgi:hypothetical protein